VTQLHDDLDDLDDLGDGWQADRPHLVPDIRYEPHPVLEAQPEVTYLAPVVVPDAGEPLFEELREAYLRGDNGVEWSFGDDRAGGWADDPSGEWAEHSSGEWAEHSSGEWAAGSHTGWDEAEDELEEDDEVEAEEFAPPAPAGRRARSTHGRVAWRRTSTLLTASTVLITVVGVAAAMALTGLIVSSRLLTTRQLFFLAHSSFGIVIVHAFGGGLGTLLTTGDSRMKDRIRKLSTAALAVVAWLASVTGTWFGYAGYRAEVPPGGDIGMYPRQYLLSSPDLAFWETFAMEWKVHIGWTTPFLATAVAFVALRYRRRLVADRLVRKVMTNLLVIAFVGALAAAVLGAVVNVAAPNDFMHRGWNP
jgi:hypothetical protein